MDTHADKVLSECRLAVVRSTFGGALNFILTLSYFADLTCQFLQCFYFADFGMPIYAILKIACESDKNNSYKNWQIKYAS